tara:strand:+ start:1085 stop:2236 length:1152 start_codon:yes stop_codon:yes gene_type:complete
MSSSVKKIGFHVAGMTDIRYFYPVIDNLISIGNHEIYLIIDDNNKYTSIYNNKKNKSIFFNIFANILRIDSEKFIDLKTHIKNSDILNLDILFSMSCDSNRKNHDFKCGKYFSYSKRIVLQHGFDYLGFKKGARSACEKTCYILNDKIYERDITKRFNQKPSFAVPEVPVQYWNFSDQIDFALSSVSPWRLANLSLEEKSAFIFYPEVGHHKIVSRHVESLLTKEYKIFIKQRRKSQDIDNTLIAKDNVFPVFDDFWLPSEAVVFPLLSNICIGYGSAGYTDLSAIRKPYIDFALTSYSKRSVDLKKFNQETGHSYEKLEDSGLPYPKPDHSDNFYYTEDPEDFDNLLSLIEDKPNYTDKNWYLNKCKNSFSAVDFISSITSI